MFNKDSFKLQKKLVELYQNPDIRRCRDEFFYNCISSEFKEGLKAYTNNDSDIIMHIAKTSVNNSFEITEKLKRLNSIFIDIISEKYPDVYSQMKREINANKVVSFSLHDLAAECCNILDITPPNSQDYIINFKFYN